MKVQIDKNQNKPIKLYNAKNKVNSSLLLGKKAFKNKIKIEVSEIVSIIAEFEKVVENNIDIKHEHSFIKYEIVDYLKEVNPDVIHSLKKKIVFSDQILNDIINNQEKSLTVKEISDKYRELVPMSNFSNETLKRYIKQNMKYKYQKCLLSNRKQNDEEHKYMHFVYCKLLSEALRNNHQIIYMDESTHNSRPNSIGMWMKKSSGTKRFNNGRIKSVNTIAAVSEFGLIYQESKSETFTSDKFIDFIKNLCYEIQKDNRFKEKFKNRQITLVLDNSKCHTSRKSIRFLKKCKLNCLFQPSYCPDRKSVV